MKNFCRFYAVLAAVNTVCGLYQIAQGTFGAPMTIGGCAISMGITLALGAWALYASAKG